MIGHTLTKLYGAVMEAELSDYMETLNLHAHEQAGFRRAFSTIDHFFTLRCLIDQTKARKKKLYCDVPTNEEVRERINSSAFTQRNTSCE